MRMRFTLALLLLAGAVACGGSGEEPAPEAGPFAYDADAPLEVRETGSSKQDDLTIDGLTYASPRGGRVPALVVVPPGDGPFAGLILQHGMPGTRMDVLPYAVDFGRLGAVVVLIDAPFARRSGEPVHFDARDRAEQIQLIVDLRRAVDLLRARDDVDEERIGYLGISYGGAMGGLLAGTEPRIAAFVLAVGDGGLVEHFSSADDAGGSLPPLAPERRRRWLAAMRPIEPLRWIARATAPLLFQSGTQDDLVPPADATRYQRVAPEPKDVQWYESGHFLPPQAVCAQARWLAEHIGINADHPAC
jgi:dienelactone hydrolase